MGKVFGIIISLVMFISGGYLIYNGAIRPYFETESVDIESFERMEMNPGDVFEAGSYIQVDNLKIVYDGKNFIVENHEDSTYMITCGVYGGKNDGTYDLVAIASFYGIDEKKYEEDKGENGWAIKQNTNIVGPNEKLVANLDVNSYLYSSAENPENLDVDKDGYYDIAFRFSKQIEGYAATVSTEDRISDYYKLKVK